VRVGVADWRRIQTLVVGQASWFALADIRIIRFVAPLAGRADSVPTIAVLVQPAARHAGVAVLVTEGRVPAAVSVLAALRVTCPVLVGELAGQRTGFVGAVDDGRPVAHRTVGVVDVEVEEEGV